MCIRVGVYMYTLVHDTTIFGIYSVIKLQKYSIVCTNVIHTVKMTGNHVTVHDIPCLFLEKCGNKLSEINGN